MIIAPTQFTIDYIDASGISEANRCLAKYMFNRQMGLILPDNPMIFLAYGTAMHFALPHCYNGTLDRALSAFKEVWDEIGHEGADDKRNLSRAEASLEVFIETHQSSICPYEVVNLGLDSSNLGCDRVSDLEVPFLVDIGGDLPLAGRIDLVVRWKTTGDIWALDFKGHPLDTILLTPRGPVRMKDLTEGDYVLTPNGKATKVIGIYPLGKRAVYKIGFSDGSFVECTSDHLWTVNYSSTNEEIRTKTITTREMAATHLEGKRKRHRYWLPKVKSASFDFQFVPIEPYTLGALLGDGHLSSTHGVTLYTNDNEILERVRVYYQGSENVDARNFLTRASVIGVKDDLKTLGLLDKKSHDKFIPASYIYNIEEVRLKVLRGLMDTDGGVSPQGSPVFVTTSARLAAGVKLIVESLGGIAKIRVENATLYDKDCGLRFVLNLRFDGKLDRVFYLRRKKTKVRKQNVEKVVRYIGNIEYVRDAECQCIKIASKDGLYLVEDFVATHNTSSEVSGRFFKNMHNTPQANAYTLATSQLNPDESSELCQGLIVEAIRTSKTNAENQMYPVWLFEHQLESFMRLANRTAKRILECNESKMWPKSCTGCGNYAMFGQAGYYCPYKDLCDAGDWKTVVDTYRQEEPFHPFRVRR